MRIFICRNHKGDLYTVVSSEGMLATCEDVVAIVNLTKIPDLKIDDIDSIGEIGISLIRQALRWAEYHPDKAISFQK